MNEANLKRPHRLKIKVVWKKVQWISTKKDHSKPMPDKEDSKRLHAQIGNLEVQVAEYQQIVKELSDKIKQYEQKYGSVFVKSTTPVNK